MDKQAKIIMSHKRNISTIKSEDTLRLKRAATEDQIDESLELRLRNSKGSHVFQDRIYLNMKEANVFTYNVAKWDSQLPTYTPPFTSNNR